MKREREEDSYDESDYSESESDLSMEEGGEEVNVDFEVNEPNFKTDIYGVETFTQALLNGEEFEYLPVVDLLMGDMEKEEPNPLTSIVKIPYEKITSAPEEGEEVDLREWEFDEDTYGVISLLPFKNEDVQKCVGSWLVQTCEKTADKSIANRMRNFINGKNGATGLFVNLHVINLPFELTSKLHENLWQEYTSLVEKGSFEKLEHLVLISTVFVPKVKKNYNKKKPSHTKHLYPKYEESFFAKYASFVHRYKMEESDLYNEVPMMDKSSGERNGIIMVIPAAEFPNALKDMESALNQSQASTKN